MALVDRKFALDSLTWVIYYPYTGIIGPFFGAYSELEKGNGLPLYDILSAFAGNLTVTCQDCSYPVAQAGVSPDADISIQCADSGALSDDLTHLKSIYDSFAAQTQLADIFFRTAVYCVYAVPNLPA